MIIGRHYQNAYVTRNLTKAVAKFRDNADIRLVIEAEVAVELWTPHGSGAGVQKLAFLWVNDLNVELIEPGSGETLSIFRDALPDHDGLVFHHVCYRVDDWQKFTERALQSAYPVVLKGGTPGMLEFVYLDTREWLGHYSEYVWMTPERWTQLGGR